jgi:hypothetical protein
MPARSDPTVGERGPVPRNAVSTRLSRLRPGSRDRRVHPVSGGSPIRGCAAPVASPGPARRPLSTADQADGPHWWSIVVRSGAGASARASPASPASPPAVPAAAAAPAPHWYAAAPRAPTISLRRQRLPSTVPHRGGTAAERGTAGDPLGLQAWDGAGRCAAVVAHGGDAGVALSSGRRREDRPVAASSRRDGDAETGPAVGSTLRSLAPRPPSRRREDH